jgi:hypothetical protein
VNGLGVLSVVGGVLALAVPAAAAEAPTISASPEVVGVGSSVTLQGTVASRRAGEDVIVEGRECRDTFFRAFGGTQSQAGGSWTFAPNGGFLRATTTFRARVGDATSRTIVVRRRLNVSLHVKGRGRFEAIVVSEYVNLHRKRVRLERFAGGRWTLVRTARLNRLAGPSYRARFTFRPRRVQLRAVVAEALVRPCYSAGVSPIARS